MNYRYTLKINTKANKIEDLLRIMDEAKEQLAAGYAVAHDKDDSSWYALSLDKDERGAP